MIVRFMGMRGQGKTTGCIPCGRRGRSSGVFHREKSITMPSGKKETFYLGMTYEESKEDSSFLLGLKDNDGRHLFEEVKDGN